MLCGTVQLYTEGCNLNGIPSRLNVRKHGIHFSDARLLVVVYTWRDDRIRLISARRATAKERRQYVENL